MNILFEIADRDLMIIGAILTAIIIGIVIIVKIINNKTKVKPISEDERFDSEIQVTEVNETDLTDEQVKARNELEKLYSQMSKDLEKQEPTPDEIDEFERDQEENAIISYQELMAEAEKLKTKANKYETVMETKADTKMDEALETYQKHEEVSKPAYQGFKNSDIISPIYGIQKKEKTFQNKTSNDIIGKAYEENYYESEKNLEFLNSLKEFRKNL